MLQSPVQSLISLPHGGSEPFEVDTVVLVVILLIISWSVSSLVKLSPALSIPLTSQHFALVSADLPAATAQVVGFVKGAVGHCMGSLESTASTWSSRRDRWNRDLS